MELSNAQFMGLVSSIMRDLTAVVAMNALLNRESIAAYTTDYDIIAGMAYKMADAMAKAGKK